MALVSVLVARDFEFEFARYRSVGLVIFQSTLTSKWNDVMKTLKQNDLVLPTHATQYILGLIYLFAIVRMIMKVQYLTKSYV